jgi:hypothetical protein
VRCWARGLHLLEAGFVLLATTNVAMLWILTLRIKRGMQE